MRRFVYMVLVMLVLSIGCAQAAELKGKSMEIELPAGWFDVSSDEKSNAAEFMSIDGGYLVISYDNIEDALGESAKSAWNALDDKIKMDYAVMMLEQYSESFPFVTPATALESRSGIISCYAEVTISDLPCGIAYVLCGDDVWFVTCTQTDSAGILDILKLIVPAGSDSQAGIAALVVSEEGYEIPEVPMVVCVNESDMNIFTTDTPEDSISLSRTTLPKENLDMYVELSGASLLITHPDEEKMDFSIKIRVKDSDYAFVEIYNSWNELEKHKRETYIDILMGHMYGDMISGHELYQTDDGVFAVFSLNDTPDDNLRYMTMHNAKIIYIQGSRASGEMTEKDLELLKTVVDSVRFP